MAENKSETLYSMGLGDAYKVSGKREPEGRYLS